MAQIDVDIHSRELRKELDARLKHAEFCSMCGPKYCPMHNFRDVDWDRLAELTPAGSRSG